MLCSWLTILEKIFRLSWCHNKDYYVYFYLCGDYVIWGLTARMLYAFLRRSAQELSEYLDSIEK